MGESEKTCIEDPRYAETRKALLGFDKKLKLYIIFAVIYGIVFINFIDVSVSGSAVDGYHFWLVVMYFFPFATISMLFPRNLQLTVGLGLVVSLMNDVFYGIVVNVMGLHLDLVWYYNRWLIPGNALLFQLNLGFAVIPVFSWMMALSIYVRIIVVYFLLRIWRAQAKIRCLNEAQTKKKGLLSKLWKNKPQNISA